MNKLLKVSMVAILAVGPVAAFAGSLNYVNNNTYNLTAAPQNGIDAAAAEIVATKAYVQGAYNAVAAAVNDNNSRIGTLDSTTLDEFTTTPANLAAAVNLAMKEAKDAAAGNGLDTSEVQGLINSAAGDGLAADSGVLSIDLAAQSAGLQLDNGKLKAKTDGTYVTTDSNGALNLTTTAQEYLGLASTALQQSDLTGYLTTSNLATQYDATDSSNAVTGVAVADALEDYVTSTALGTTLATYATTSSLGSYVTTSTLANKGVEVATTWGVDTTGKVGLTDLVTQ